MLPRKDSGVKVVCIELLQQSTANGLNLVISLKEVVEIVTLNGFNRIVWDGTDLLSWQSPRQSTNQNVEVEDFASP